MAVTSVPLSRSSPDAKTLKQWGIKLFFYVVMSILALIFLAPLIWMVSASVKPEAEVMRIPPTLIPSQVQWGNYLEVWAVIPYFLLNSLKLAVLSVVGVLVVSSLGAYAFARLDFWGRDFAFSVLLATVMVPGIVTLIPLYVIYTNIGWIDTHYPLWVPRMLHSVFAVFLLRQFFKQIPKELDEAARIDGAGSFRIFWQIMIPQVQPALGAIAIFTFLDSWNDLFGPLIFLNSIDLQTLPIALKLFQREFFSQVNVLMAGATISIVPVLIVFFSAQRYFIQGIALTGIK